MVVVVVAFLSVVPVVPHTTVFVVVVVVGATVVVGLAVVVVLCAVAFWSDKLASGETSAGALGACSIPSNADPARANANVSPSSCWRTPRRRYLRIVAPSPCTPCRSHRA